MLLSSAALTLPVVAVLFIPVLVGMSAIYPWAASATALPAFKAAYLDAWFFTLAHHRLFRGVDGDRGVGGAGLRKRRGDETRRLGRTDRLGADRRHGRASIGSNRSSRIFIRRFMVF